MDRRDSSEGPLYSMKSVSVNLFSGEIVRIFKWLANLADEKRQQKRKAQPQTAQNQHHAQNLALLLLQFGLFLRDVVVHTGIVDQPESNVKWAYLRLKVFTAPF